MIFQGGGGGGGSRPPVPPSGSAFAGYYCKLRQKLKTMTYRLKSVLLSDAVEIMLFLEVHVEIPTRCVCLCTEHLAHAGPVSTMFL